jgi:hypothetical protein
MIEERGNKHGKMVGMELRWQQCGNWGGGVNMGMSIDAYGTYAHEWPYRCMVAWVHDHP